jgi:hypothetical protein
MICNAHLNYQPGGYSALQDPGPVMQIEYSRLFEYRLKLLTANYKSIVIDVSLQLYLKTINSPNYLLNNRIIPFAIRERPSLNVSNSSHSL